MLDATTNATTQACQRMKEQAAGPNSQSQNRYLPSSAAAIIDHGWAVKSDVHFGKLQTWEKNLDFVFEVIAGCNVALSSEGPAWAGKSKLQRQGSQLQLWGNGKVLWDLCAVVISIS